MYEKEKTLWIITKIIIIVHITIINFIRIIIISIETIWTAFGPTPRAINIEKRTEENENYRTTLWTRNNLQLTLMSIPVDSDIGLEVHPKVDQFLKLKEERGLVELGPTPNDLSFRKKINSNYAILFITILLILIINL